MNKQQQRPSATEERAVAKAPIQDLFAVDGQGGASGFENVKPGDTAVPFIYILQALSPQVKRGHPQFISTAKDGFFFNNVTLEVLEPPIVVIPCFYQKSFVEWMPRDSGGGFVKAHPDESILEGCKKNEKNLDVLPNGNHVIQTAYYFVLNVRKDGKCERSVLSFTRTQLKKSRRWLSQMMSLQLKVAGKGTFRPPMFSHSYELDTILEQKDKFSWYGFRIGSPKILVSEEQYLMARTFHQECNAGAVKVKEPAGEHVEDDILPPGKEPF